MATFIPMSLGLVMLFFSSNIYLLTKAADTTTNSDVHVNLGKIKTFKVDKSLINQGLIEGSGSSCKAPPKLKGRRKANSLHVSNRFGGCTPLTPTSKKAKRRPTYVETLKRDQERVNSIIERVNSRLGKAVQVNNLIDIDINNPFQQKNLALPAKSGNTIGSGNFVVTVGFGTPALPQTLMFDTGSDLTWIQCEPCSRSCYEQQEPIFNPKGSLTYSNVSCGSQLCTDVESATFNQFPCSSSTCVYGIQYGDSSFSVGYVAKDTLTLGINSVPSFIFGCGQNNQGLWSGTAGLLGLARNKLSTVGQTASQFGNYFSYCLPSTSSDTGHLTFGEGGLASTSIKYTPLLLNPQAPNFYFLDFQGFSVGGRKLAIAPSVFSSGTIIDSGTVITRLPPAAYYALKSAFTRAMSNYPRAPPASILDTCYDFSDFDTIRVPKVSMLFGGGVSQDLSSKGIFLAKSISQVCLAFAANSDPSDIGIIGNVQQVTFDVIYDVAGGKLGFGAGGCA